MIPLMLALTLEIAPATLMRTVAEGSDSPIRKRLEAVIRTPVEWKALSHRLASDSTAQAIDFAHEMAVAVFVGPLHAPGARVDIFSVAREDGVIVVRYRVHRPPPSTPLAQIVAAPYQAAEAPPAVRDPHLRDVLVVTRTDIDAEIRQERPAPQDGPQAVDRGDHTEARPLLSFYLLEELAHSRALTQELTPERCGRRAQFTSDALLKCEDEDVRRVALHQLRNDARGRARDE